MPWRVKVHAGSEKPALPVAATVVHSIAWPITFNVKKVDGRSAVRIPRPEPMFGRED
jgi:hypothetical protein